MSLPAPLHTVTVSGQYEDIEGNPLSGSVTFISPTVLTANSGLMLGGSVTVTLDATGSFTVPLLATDDPAVNPSGWTYTVHETIAGLATRTYPLSLPNAAPTVNLGQVVPVSYSSGTVAIVTGPAGPAGPQGTPTTVNGKSGASITLNTTDLPDANMTLPSDHGLITWTQDPAGINPSGATLSSGALAMCKVFLRSTKTVGNVWYIVTGAGAALTGTFVGLYSSTGVLIDQTADQSTAFTATGPHSAPLGTSHSLAAGWYWLAFLVSAGTTMPTVARGTSAVLGAANVNLSPANYRFGAYGSGLSALPASITVANITNVTNGTIWGALS